MKPVQIVLLVVAGALGGAIVTRNWNKPHGKAAPAITAQAQPQPATSAPAPAPEPAAQAPAPVATPPAAVESTPEPAKPSPAPRPVAPKPRHTAKATPPPANPRPVETIPVEAKAIPPAAQPAAAPVEPSPAPAPRSEPEHVTSAPAPPPAPPEPNRVTLNAGMLIPVRLVDGLSSERNMPGDVFTGTLDRELVVDGFVIAERGARVDGRVVSSDQGGKVKGVASLAIEVTRIRTSDGQTVAVQTDAFERHAEASHRSDATKVGAGAALGAIIGAIAGGGKGAAIGAGAGGAAGAGTVLMTRGKAATLTSETRINFRLRAPVTITEKK